MRDTGPCLNPFEAYQLLSGLETLSVRLERNSTNALELALTLEDNAAVGEVRYPGLSSSFLLPHNVLTAQGLASNPLHHISTKYLNRNYGGVLYFTMKDEQRLASIVDKFKLVSPSGR